MVSKRPLPGAFVVPPSVVLGPRTRTEGAFSDDSVALLYRKMVESNFNKFVFHCSSSGLENLFI